MKLQVVDGEEGTDPLLSPSDLMFDPWCCLEESALTGLKDVIGRDLLAALMTGRSGRKPRLELVKGIEVITSSLLANLLMLHRDRPPGARLVMPMKRAARTRYDRQGFRQLTRVVRACVSLGLIDLRPAVFKKRRTTIAATTKLRAILRDAQVDLSSIVRAEGEEVIQLVARPKVRRVAGRKQANVLVSYEDTEETRALRAEIELINRSLSDRMITLRGSVQPVFRLVRRFTLRDPDDPHLFNLHGRLYGGFWMTLKASERAHLRIDGEAITDLDFASMFPCLAYHRAGSTPPKGDLYAVPGLEDHRDGAKAGLSALLSYGSDMKRLPDGLKEQLPEGWTARRLVEAMSSRHPHLAPFFGKDMGLELMFTESRILLAAMKRLIAQGITALPMHDGMMVARSRREAAKDAMEEAAQEVLGFRLPVVEKS